MENKKTKIISIIAIIALVLTLVTATYAYFQDQTGEGSQADVKINANTVDTLTFETGSAISLSLDQTSFAQGTGNKTGNTFAKAILTANNKTNTATEHYYLYLNISSNTFTYTQNESTPEILLTIKDESNNEITSINGLTYKTITDASGASITGFDITTKSGLITLFDNREITTTSSKTETWNVIVTYINYDADQSKNAGKSFNAKLIIQKDKYVETAATVCSSGQTLNSCIVAMNGLDNFIYHHDGTLENGINDGSYRYAGPSEEVNNFVCFGTNTSPCPTDNLYRIVGVFGENYHGVTNQQLVKLIKYDFATSSLLGTDGDYYGSSNPDATYYKGSLTSISVYHWNYKADTEINSGLGSNTWSTSLLNKTNLNTNFINNIGTEWANKIVTTTWKVGGSDDATLLRTSPLHAYQYEIIEPFANESTDNATEYEAKIGLMYVSDYYYAASPNAWTLLGSDSDTTNSYESATSINWMYMGYNDWTITRNASGRDSAFEVDYTGGVGYFYVADNNNGVRPSFNLKPSITYKSGSGTMSDPILIN